MKRVLPCSNCMNHRIISKDVITYGYKVNVRWTGENFGDCNDVLFFPEDLEYSVLFAPSERLPVIISVLYSKPDIVKEVRIFVVKSVKEFIKCLFNYAEIFAKDVVALDYIPKAREILEESKEMIGGPKYVADVNVLYEELLDNCKRLCKPKNRGIEEIEEVILGPEIDIIKHTSGIAYSIQGNFMYIHDGLNSVFIDVRGIDPFEVGEEYVLIAYGVYHGRELVSASYIGEETLEEEHLRKLVNKNIIREDGKLKSPQTIAKKLTDIIYKES